VISPHGAVRNAGGFVADRVVDGGYFENNGALTAADLAEELARRGLKPVIIQITNEPQARQSVCAYERGALPAPVPDSRTAFAVFTSPVGALLRTTTARGTLASTDLCRFADASPLTLFAPFAVSPQKGLLGEKQVSMSWWLSRNVRNYLDHQIDQSAPDVKVSSELDNGALFKQIYELIGRDPSVAATRPEAAGRVSNSTKFEDIADEYVQTFDAAVFDQDRVTQIDWYVDRIIANRSRYEAVETATGVPWYFVALLHAEEAGLSFNRHLHNGDPLTARTVQVPKGRPTTGSPPFTWEESGIDAMNYDRLAHQSDWSLARMLYRLEVYNGFSYRRRFGFKTPYLWSGSNQYVSGKYVADGVFDPLAKSRLVGAAVLLKALVNRGAVSLSR
jgi:lysozyme family protein